ncbi:MAG: putative aminophospholipid-translocase [Stictis urceolatum]|nr:putative aminophospholipid-translocase [Stictis urceolata]
MEDDHDSDLELDLQELAPNSPKSPSRQGFYSPGEEHQIPLQILRSDRLRVPKRRQKKFEHIEDDDDAEPGTPGNGATNDSLDGGDSTPLLQSDAGDPVVRRDPRPKKITDRLRLPSFRRRGSVLPSIYDASDEAVDESTKSAPRSINIGQHPPPRFPQNAISNAKYTPWSFLPRTLYNEFSFFINLYFLVVALSQIFKPLRIGVLWTYMAPLAFVLAVTLGKEAYDDIERRRRDGEANREFYTILSLRNPPGRSKKTKGGKGGHRRIDDIENEEETLGETMEVDEVMVKSKDIKVGDVLKLNKNDRVPADVIILKSYVSEAAPYKDTAPKSPALLFEQNEGDNLLHLPTETANSKSQAESKQGQSNGDGEAFIRTDQLDGETDWKLRIASPLTQSLNAAEFVRLTIKASKPSKKVNEFIGRMELSPKVSKGHSPSEEISPKDLGAPLSIDNTAWANTVLASSSTVLAVVVYTGAQTRQALSTSPSRSKVGLLEFEINNLTKILCVLTITLSAILVILQYYSGTLANERSWFISLSRFLILFSTIIPISLRVNLDLGKSVYAYYIQHDKDIPDTVVRTSTIPEDLGRIEYLLSDKTGTLTQNEMDLRKVHVGTVSYANEAMEEVTSHVRQGFAVAESTDPSKPASLVTPTSLLNLSASGATGARARREIGARVRDLVLALALCHNVTPTSEEQDGYVFTAYQASSPDEIAIVRWTESVGLRVVHRDRHSIALECVETGRIAVRVRILDVFPFTSESKRMGIVLQYMEGTESSQSTNLKPGEIWFYQKGADTVMTSIVAANDWLDEETANMAREGLRTLVVGRRRLSPQQHADFSSSYKEASMSLQSRDATMAHVIRTYLEHNLELLGVTGVEDRLQKDVKPSLELLRNAGIKIWMLTGDKVETARCVAVSSKLVSRSQHIHIITSLEAQTRISSSAVPDTLSLLSANPSSTALLIDGDSLSHLLTHHKTAFISLAVQLPAVIACRCSPTQKADVALLIRAHTRKRVACIGDGGNDVSMIQAADIGVGIVGKEGRQASLAADFSITQFHHLTKLLVWHGRNSYKRSAKLAQFVIHRGLVISVAQTVYSATSRFEPNALFRDWLLVGYATLYTQFPVFSLVLDKDVDEKLANLYPELYKELTPGSSLSYRTFFVWLLVSVYQGSLIQILAQILVGATTDQREGRGEFGDPSMVAVAFTALVVNELVMMAMSVTTWHWIMVACIVFTFGVYGGSVPALGDYFDLAYVWSWGFVWRVAAIAGISLVPPYVVKVVRRTVKPPSYRKVRGV